MGRIDTHTYVPDLFLHFALLGCYIISILDYRTESLRVLFAASESVQVYMSKSTLSVSGIRFQSL